MATMQVSVLRKAGDIGVEEREVPTPGRGEVLVEIGSVGVCGSDVHYYEHGRIGRWDPLESTCRHASLSIL